MNINLAIFFKKYWLILLLTGLISASVALVATYVLSPAFKAKVNIFVMPREDALAAGVMVNPKQLFAQTQGKIVIAPEVTKQTVINLRLDRKKSNPSAFMRKIQVIKEALGSALAFLKYGYIKKASRFDSSLSALEASLETMVLEDTNIIEVEVSWDNPRTAALIANEVARQFAIFSRRKNEEEMDRILKVVKKEINQREEELRLAGQQLLDFKAKHNFVGVGSLDAETGMNASDQAKLILLEKEMAAAENNLMYWQDLYQGTKSKLVVKQEQIRVLGPAKTPLYPVKPVKLLYASIGFLVGILVGLALSVFLEMNNKVIYTPDDIKNALGVPVLTTFPRKKNNYTRKA